MNRNFPMVLFIEILSAAKIPQNTQPTTWPRNECNEMAQKNGKFDSSFTNRNISIHW